jgi:hypothetical protein
MIENTIPSLPTVLGVIAGWYLVVPLIVWGKFPRGKGWQTEPFDPMRHHTSPELTEFLRANVTQLVDAGFRQAGDLIHHSSVTTTRVAVLAHSDGVVATVVVLARAPRIGGKGAVTVALVEFTALLTTGTVLDVNNSPSLPIFAARADHVVYRFPWVRDSLRLYHIYQVMLRRSFGSAMLTQPDVSDPVQYLKQATEREYRRQVDTGYYRFDDRTDEYVMTLKGAYLAAWKSMIPFRWIRAALFARKSRALMQQTEW